MIEINGRQVVMTRWEAFLSQIQTLALKKDASAARLLARSGSRALYGSALLRDIAGRIWRRGHSRGKTR
jgi:hypothetical protein